MHVLVAVPLSADHGRPDPGTCRGLTAACLAFQEIGMVAWGPDDLGGAGAVHLQRQYAAAKVRAEKTWSHLWFVDSDVCFGLEDARRLLKAQAMIVRLLKVQAMIVTGCYITKEADGRACPCTYFDRDDGAFVPQLGRGFQKIGAAGLGFCLIAREVFENTDGPWFVPGREDLDFFRKATAAGFQAWCDYDIDLGHAGRKVWTRADAEITARRLGILPKEAP